MLILVVLDEPVSSRPMSDVGVGPNALVPWSVAKDLPTSEEKYPGFDPQPHLRNHRTSESLTSVAGP